jgi:hypothetical protein
VKLARSAVVAAAALLLGSGIAAAQATPGNASLSFESLAKAPAGAWAEYSMMLGTKKGGTMRYSLVEKSAKSLGLEIETVTPPLVMRMDFSANGPSAWKLSRIRMRMGSGPVQDAPPPEGTDQAIKKGGNFGTLLGSEPLKTPAGSFQCRHYKQTTAEGVTEVWMSDQVLPSGLVQTTVASLGARITLESTGTGATAKIK